MHYYIDGYNLMFRLGTPGPSFSAAREWVIEEIRVKSSMVRLTVTLVFDAHSTSEEPLPRHLGDLELCYSKHGETADDWILTRLRGSKHPSRITVVTSDSRLGAQVRQEGGHTVDVETFCHWLDRRCDKVNHNRPIHKGVVKAVKAEPEAVKKVSKKEPNRVSKTGDRWLDYYLEVFEERFSRLEEEEGSHDQDI